MHRHRTRLDDLKKEVIGTTVLTKHGGNRLYTVVDVKHDLTPADTFKMRGDKKEISYQEYFQTRYGLNCKDMNQPLLAVQPTGKMRRTCFMLPEFAFPTGLDDETRKNFNTMRALAQETNKSAGERLKIYENLLKEMQRGKDNKVFKEWGIEVGSTPKSVMGAKLAAGFLQMGKGKKVALDRVGANFERDTQAQMYDQASIDSWTIFHLPSKQRTLNEFMSKLQ